MVKTSCWLSSNSSGSWWAATVAIYCPGKTKEHSWWKSTGGFYRPDLSPCISFGHPLLFCLDWVSPSSLGSIHLSVCLPLSRSKCPFIPKWGPATRASSKEWRCCCLYLSLPNSVSISVLDPFPDSTESCKYHHARLLLQWNCRCWVI